MVIKWAPLATKSLKEIYYFYLPQTGRPKARSIADELRQETRYLLIFPEMGRKEAMDNGQLSDYRYIVKGYYKIYYVIYPTYILITLVWDTRRNPELLTQLLNTPPTQQ